MKFRKILAAAMSLTLIFSAVTAVSSFVPDFSFTASAAELSELTVVAKGNEGGFTVMYYSDGSLMITGLYNQSLSSVDIPVSINDKPVRSIEVIESGDYDFWNGAIYINVPPEVAFVTDYTTEVTYTEASKSFLLYSGILLKVNESLSDYTIGSSADINYSIDIDNGVVTISGTGTIRNDDFIDDYFDARDKRMNQIWEHIGEKINVDPVYTNVYTQLWDQFWAQQKYDEINYNEIDDNGLEFSEIQLMGEYVLLVAFDNDLLESRTVLKVIIEEGVTGIGEEAFSSGYIGEIFIPQSMETIGSKAFYHCDNLTAINVAEDNENYSSIDGVLYNKNQTRLIFYPRAKEGEEYISPETCTSINDQLYDGAFWGNEKIQRVYLSENVIQIGAQAFYCRNLESITIMNPDCYIYDAKDTTYFYHTYNYETDEWEEKQIPITIYGYSGSTAQTYAEKYGHNFVALDELTTDIIYGDANLDRKVSVADAVAILQSIGNRDKYALSEAGKAAADVDGVPGITPKDALVIQQVNAGIYQQSDLPLKA